MTIPEMKKIDDLERELKARGEILEAITKNIGEGNCWLSCADMDWQQRTRDFAEGRINHQMTRKQWKMCHDSGKITLFIQGNFATAYFDDADELNSMTNDELPACSVESSPRRACIHMIHLVNWLCELASSCHPVQVVDMQFIQPE